MNSNLTSNDNEFQLFPLFCYYLKIISAVYVIIITLAFDYIVCVVKVFHPNLRFILLSFPWCYLGLFISSLIKDFFEKAFPCDNKIARFFDHLLLICLVSICFNLFIFVLERIFALIYVNTYESQTTPFLSIALFICQYAMSAVLIVFTHGIVSIILIFTSVVASGIILIRFPSISRDSHTKHLSTSHGNISIRYQSVENLKAARLLRYLFIYLIPAEPLIPIIFAIIFFIVPKVNRDPFFDLLHVFIAIHLSIALCIIIRLNDSYFSQVRRIFRMEERKRGSVQSVTGKNLNIALTLHSTTHFQMINNSWK
ncbi:hypothetical protein PRIPAC_88190 [Pristionchus pacificus]|uniref:G protein-coupled receptor n=1 Tax=Pristionchus pacificus TaxID=54126 RepID=A0A2A6BZ60_PRIPA|nr:hypothetical protein PRIPAC_88190 [Pristionchus pacificus]|eukprot:PDM71149.1 G protein-coupled receptor [Pristionchus pacificus]